MEQNSESKVKADEYISLCERKGINLSSEQKKYIYERFKSMDATASDADYNALQIDIIRHLEKPIEKEEFRDKVLGGPNRTNLERIAKLKKRIVKYPQDESFRVELQEALSEINKAYGKVSPELARFREEELKEIEAGKDPALARETRRKKVQAYYQLRELMEKGFEKF